MTIVPSYKLLQSPAEVVARIDALPLSIRPVASGPDMRPDLVELGLYREGDVLLGRFFCRKQEVRTLSLFFDKPAELLFSMKLVENGVKGMLSVVLTSDHLPQKPISAWEQERTHTLEELTAPQLRKAFPIADFFRHKSEMRFFESSFLCEADDFVISMLAGEEGTLSEADLMRALGSCEGPQERP